jgi:hypothetical protein
MLFFYGLQGILFSYLIFGQIAKISWDILNKSAAKENSEEVIICKISKFWTSKSSNQIEFQFENKLERFNVSYSTIKPYLKTNPKDYYLKIEANKGIWNYYLVNNWEIIKNLE